MCGRYGTLHERSVDEGGWPVSTTHIIYRMMCPAGHVSTGWHGRPDAAYKAWCGLVAWTSRRGGTDRPLHGEGTI